MGPPWVPWIDVSATVGTLGPPWRWDSRVPFRDGLGSPGSSPEGPVPPCAVGPRAPGPDRSAILGESWAVLKHRRLEKTRTTKTYRTSISFASRSALGRAMRAYFAHLGASFGPPGSLLERKARIAGLYSNRGPFLRPSWSPLEPSWSSLEGVLARLGATSCTS